MKAYEFIMKMKDNVSDKLKRIARSVGVSENRLLSLGRAFGYTERQAQKFTSVMSGMKSALLGVFMTLSIGSFINSVVQARSEYETFAAVLENTFQSKEMGDSAMAMLADFAAKTPFQLNELQGGFVKLVNRGIIPTQAEMTKLGDLASSQGKSFDQLTEAILDAMSGEFERMKEFGIKASKDGNNVALTFKGITKNVANTEDAIKQAILQFGELPGVAGGMEKISQTLGGQISNLEDSWHSLLVKIGGESGGIFSTVIGYLNQGVDYISDHVSQISYYFQLLWSYISPIVKKLGDFVRAALGIQSASGAMEAFKNIAYGVLLAVDVLSTGIITLLSWLEPMAPMVLGTAIAWALLNIHILAIPLAIIAIIAVIGILMKYTDGWGASWEALKNIVSIFWKQIQLNFQKGVDTVIYKFEFLRLKSFEIFEGIVQKFRNVGEAIKLALDGDFDGATAAFNQKVDNQFTDQLKNLEAQRKTDQERYKEQTKANAADVAKNWKNVGVTLDSDGVERDFNKIKADFANIGKPGETTDPNAYLKGTGTALGAKTDATGDKDKKGKKSDSVTGGGQKQTNITINFGKLNEKIEIHTTNLQEGSANIEEMLQQMLLRVLNSANQMDAGYN